MKPLQKQMDMLESRRLAVALPYVRGRLLDIGCGYNNLVRAYGSGVGVEVPNGCKLTDMATAYKVFRSKVIKGLKLRSARFEFEPEVAAKLLLAGHKIVEVPISYNPRSVDEGKKVGWIDGIEYIYTLLKYRFFEG